MDTPGYSDPTVTPNATVNSGASVIPEASVISEAWHNWFAAQRQRIDAGISAHLNRLKAADPAHSPLLASVEYSLTLPSKRLRPVLVLECCRVCGGDESSAMPAALAVECVHTFSLVHDDLPAMDDDDLRRGQPTNHRVYGEAGAILAGDWLAAHAFELAAAIGVPSRAAEAVAVLAAATTDMIAGQAADIAGEGRDPDGALVEFVHHHKTARLIEASCRLGAIAADAPAAAAGALSAFGRHLGLAFQIVDDLLDRTGSTAALGKRAGKDEADRKQTYPAVVGVEASRSAAGCEIESALAALAEFGAAAENLRELARFVERRDH